MTLKEFREITAGLSGDYRIVFESNSSDNKGLETRTANIDFTKDKIVIIES